MGSDKVILDERVCNARRLDEGSCGIAYSQKSNGLGSEEVYIGTSVSESGLSAGIYDIDFFADGATDVVYVLSYPADTLDFEGASPDSLYEPCAATSAITCVRGAC